MTQEASFGKTSYLFANGSIAANSRTVLTAEQLQRVEEADTPGALRILDELGYGGGTPGGIDEKTQAELAYVSAYVAEIAPDRQLLGLFFFEEDAHNLKVYLKAQRFGVGTQGLISAACGTDPELFRICAQTEDFSMFGADFERQMAQVRETDDPHLLCAAADRAIFAYYLQQAKKENTLTFRLLQLYGAYRNRLTAKRMGEREPSPLDLLPVDGQVDYSMDKALSRDEIVVACEQEMQALLAQYAAQNDGAGPLISYLFAKKQEAKTLRVLFAKKRARERAAG